MALTSIALKQDICDLTSNLPINQPNGSEVAFVKNTGNGVGVPPTWVGYDYDLTNSPCTGGNDATSIWGWEFQGAFGQIFFPSPIRLDDIVAMQAIIDSQLIPALGLVVGDIIYVVNPDNTVTEWFNPSVGIPAHNIVIGDTLTTCDKVEAITPTVHTAPIATTGSCYLVPLAFEIPTPKINLFSSQIVPFVDLPYLINFTTQGTAQLLKRPEVIVHDMPQALINAGICLELGIYKRGVSPSKQKRGKKSGFTCHNDWDSATQTTTFAGSADRGGKTIDNANNPLPFNRYNMIPVTAQRQVIQAWVALENVLVNEVIFFIDNTGTPINTNFIVAGKNSNSKSNRPSGNSEFAYSPKKAPTYFAFRYVLPYTDINGRKQFKHGGWSQTLMLVTESEPFLQDTIATQALGNPVATLNPAYNFERLTVRFA